MLRLRPSLTLRSAQSIKDPFISQLLPVVGDLSSAANELRWMRDDCQKRTTESNQQSLLEQHVLRRSRGEPLQYILGSAYFGDLEIKCRPGVFIPRPATAAAVSFLVKSLVSRREKLAEDERTHQAHTQPGTKIKQRKPGRKSTIRVFDLCCGSGCIPLLFWHQFYNSASCLNFPVPHLEVIGFDASSEALELTRENHATIMSQQRDSSSKATLSLQQMEFIQANVLRQKTSPEELGGLNTLRQAIAKHAGRLTRDGKILDYVRDTDIWISNPPYVSAANYMNTTSQSVRDFEPEAALVPPGDNSDCFHQDILVQAIKLRAKVVLLEVDDKEQAHRVVKFAVGQHHWHTFEIWRDIPSEEPYKVTRRIEPKAPNKYVRTMGFGHPRSVLLCTRDGADLIGRYAATQKEMQRKAQKVPEPLKELNQRMVEKTKRRHGAEQGTSTPLQKTGDGKTFIPFGIY